MINSTVRMESQRSLDYHPNPRRHASGAGRSFSAETLDVMNTGPGRRESSPASSGVRQILGAGQPTPTAPATAKPTSTPTAAPLMSTAPTPQAQAQAPDSTTGAAPQSNTAAAATPPLTGDAAVVQALKDALTAAGINTNGLGLEAHQDVVTYPGGSYINRYISVNSNGHEEGLMTDLVGINPKIAVLDIQHMLSRSV